MHYLRDMLKQRKVESAEQGAGANTCAVDRRSEKQMHCAVTVKSFLRHILAGMSDRRQYSACG